MIVDTTALVALFDEDHPHHLASRSALQDSHITATRGGLVEFTTVLRRVAKASGMDGSKVARTALLTLRSMPGFREAPDCGLESIVRAYIEDSRLSLADAWALRASLESREELLTFDSKLKAAYDRSSGAP